ncbi:hypothetical protein [Verrucomicrobium sp. BvORR106]|uniref:hypothetical protein n=1 Tax=Verrucomicrobium sp. BvORR106 TaxID=1403819 RepID=UPI00056EFBE0|nr:hypothetical protein [Verrucomicrobium sp. BvORR106]
MPELPVIPSPAEPIRPSRVRELPLNRLVDDWIPDGADLATPTAGISRYARQLILGNGTLYDPELSTHLRIGSGVPSNSFGVVGDLYVNRLTGWLYEKTAITTWTLRGVFAVSIGNTQASFVCPDGTTRTLSFSPAETLCIALGDQVSDIETGLRVTFHMPFAFTLSSTQWSLVEGATGSAFIGDIQVNDVSIFETKPSIDAGETTSDTAATPQAISTEAIPYGAKVTIFIDQVGAVTAGIGPVVSLIGNRT